MSGNFQARQILLFEWFVLCKASKMVSINKLLSSSQALSFSLDYSYSLLPPSITWCNALVTARYLAHTVSYLAHYCWARPQSCCSRLLCSLSTLFHQVLPSAKPLVTACYLAHTVSYPAISCLAWLQPCLLSISKAQRGFLFYQSTMMLAMISLAWPGQPSAIRGHIPQQLTR